MQKWTSRFIITWAMTILSVTLVIAQETCSELIEEALAAVDEHCETLDVNNACYGFDFVQAAFLSEVADDFFTTPADLAAIVELETIATAALDEEAGTWGVAVMSVQANIPNTLPGQAVTFVLMGDTEVENGVAPDEAFQPSDGIEVVVNAPQGGNVRTGPGLNFNVIGAVADDTTIVADARSEDGAWYRIAYRDRIGWVNEILLVDTESLSDLPVMTPELRTSMQAFYLRTGIGTSSCEEAPDDILLIQGPNNIEIELTINGANVEIGSTVGFRIVRINGEPFLEMMVFSGQGRINGLRVPVGYRTLLCLGEEESRGTDDEANDWVVNCDPSIPEQIEDFGAEWCFLEQLPISILNYQIDILCPGETPPPTVSTGGGTASTSQIGDVDCSSFALIAPLIPVDAGNHTFSWTAAGGDNLTYELVFYNVDGVQVETFFTTDTTYFLNLGAQTATGGVFEWEVRLFQNGVYACVTARSPRLMRTAGADPPPVGSAGSFSASKTCTQISFDWFADISWSGALASDTVSATANSGSLSANGSGASGSFSLGPDSTSIFNITVTTSSGDSIGLGNCP